MSMGISRANRAWIEEAARRAEKQEQSRNVPSRWTGAPREYRLSIIGGNTLSSGQPGIKHVDNVQTTVPAAYDPDVTTSYANGWGNAYLLINGVLQTGKVLVCVDQLGGVDTLVEGWQVLSAGPSALPVSGAPSTALVFYRGLSW